MKEEADNRPKESLLLATARARKDQPEATEADKQLEEEADIMKHVLQKQALKAVKELANVGAAGVAHGTMPAWTHACLHGCILSCDGISMPACNNAQCHVLW